MGIIFMVRHLKEGIIIINISYGNDDEDENIGGVFFFIIFFKLKNIY